MTALATHSPTSREAIEDDSGERCWSLGAVEWETYQAIAKALTGRHVRLTYDRGRLEFMTISGKHGNLSRLLGQFIAALADEFGIPRRQFGDMTCDNESALRGLEPDECFYLENEPLVRGKDDIDLTVDPPPDLAIEIELSRSRPSRTGIYAALRIPEVWRFDGERLTVNQLSPTGNYTESASSRFFPTIPVSELPRFLAQRTQVDENSLLKSFREWVRQQITK